MQSTSWESSTAVCYTWASLVAQRVKHLPAVQETRVRSLGWEDLLEKEMATHSSILAWRIPWTEEPGGLQSMGWQRVGHNWATSLSLSCYTWRLLREWIRRVLIARENIFFYFFNFVPICDDGCSLNLLWSSFHDVCKSNHHAICLKFIECCMSIISQ